HRALHADNPDGARAQRDICESASSAIRWRSSWLLQGKLRVSYLKRRGRRHGSSRKTTAAAQATRFAPTTGLGRTVIKRALGWFWRRTGPSPTRPPHTPPGRP